MLARLGASAPYGSPPSMIRSAIAPSLPECLAIARRNAMHQGETAGRAHASIRHGNAMHRRLEAAGDADHEQDFGTGASHGSARNG